MGMGVVFEFRVLGQDTLANERVVHCGVQAPAAYNNVYRI
jgi:hypothetical protein